MGKKSLLLAALATSTIFMGAGEAKAVCAYLVTTHGQELTAEQLACQNYLKEQRERNAASQVSHQNLAHPGVQGVDWVWEGDGNTVPFSKKILTENGYGPAPVANTGSFVIGGTEVKKDFDLVPGILYVTKQVYDVTGKMQVAWQDGTLLTDKQLSQLKDIASGKYAGVDYSTQGPGVIGQYTPAAYQESYQNLAHPGVQGVDWVWEGDGVTVPFSKKILTEKGYGPAPVANTGPFVIGGSEVKKDFDLVPGIPYVTMQTFDELGNMQVSWQDGTPLTDKQLSQLKDIASGKYANAYTPPIQEIMADFHNGVVNEYTQPLIQGGTAAFVTGGGAALSSNLGSIVNVDTGAFVDYKNYMSGAGSLISGGGTKAFGGGSKPDDWKIM